MKRVVLFCSALIIGGCGSGDSAGEHKGEPDAGAGGAPSTGGSSATGGASTAGGAGSGGVVGTGGGVETGGLGHDSGGSGGRTGAGGSSAGGSTTGGAGGVATGAVCQGTPPPPSGYTTCRTFADCPSGTFACSRDPLPGCGICQRPPTTECELDGDCGAERLCESYAFSSSCLCGPVPNPLKRCVGKCPGVACAAGTECSADGRCLPTSCTKGYDCGPAQVCAPARNTPDPHGCAPASCKLDGYVCPQGTTCSTDGSCVDVSCVDGFVCPLNTDCLAGSGGPHGCAQRACTTDADCDCGACIEAKCESRLFVCSFAAP